MQKKPTYLAKNCCFTSKQLSFLLQKNYQGYLPLGFQNILHGITICHLTETVKGQILKNFLFTILFKPY